MRLSSAARAVLFVLALLAGPSVARADEGAVTLIILKAGWFFGGSAGTGVMTFHGKTYGLSAGGIDYGLVFGGSQTTLNGRVRNIRRAEDIAGVYAAAGAGVAFGAGVRGIVLTNQNGAILELSGKQLGLMANIDLSGLAITLKQ
jgi:lipid-binding SYLF domain-containing protein